MNKKKVSEKDYKKYALFGLVSFLGLVFAINLLVNYVYAKQITIGTTSDQVGIGTSTPAEKLVVSGNAVITGTLSLGGVARSVWPTDEASVTPSPIYRTTLYGTSGDLPFRTTANTPQSMRAVYGPFSYANGGITCPAGYEKYYKIYSESVDGITTGGQKQMLRLLFDNSGKTVDFDMGSTWGGAPSYRTWLSGFFQETDTNHVTVQTWVSGTAGPYMEVRKIELLAYCIYIP